MHSQIDMKFEYVGSPTLTTSVIMDTTLIMVLKQIHVLAVLGLVPESLVYLM